MIKDRFPKDWKLPNVYLLHGELSNEEMNYLYNHPKVKAMVSFTHGEGYGRPLQEATMVGLPVMVSGWSGHLDFLNPDQSLLVPGELKQVPQSQVWKDIIIPEASWFNIDTNSAYKGFNMLFNDIDVYNRKAKSLMETNKEKFSMNKMTEKLDEIVSNYTSDLPQQVELQLPRLKKIKETV